MIYVDMMGRLGNQMFQYAFARKISKLTNDSQLIFNFSRVTNSKAKTVGLEDSLKYFNVKTYKTNKKIELTFMQLLLIYLLKILLHFCKSKEQEQYIEQKMSGILGYFGVYWYLYGYIEFSYCSTVKNKYCFGFFESPKFFEEIDEELLNEFTPISDKKEDNAELYDLIENCNSVCVSIRAGDFLDTNKNKGFNVCGQNYFYRAMDYMNEKVPDVVFIIFSDDIEYVMNNYTFKYQVIYESGKDPVWEKLRLMYSCKHFIISNSTFAWWAQHLGRNQNKIVIAPKVWRKYDHTVAIYEDNWFLVDNDDVI